MTRERNPEKNRQAVKKHYDNNKEYYIERNRKKKKAITAWLISEKEVPCLDCDIQFPHYIMEFDHVEKKDGNIWSKTTWKSVRIERAKCEVVCSNCHAARTYFRRIHADVVERYTQ